MISILYQSFFLFATSCIISELDSDENDYQRDEVNVFWASCTLLCSVLVGIDIHLSHSFRVPP